MNDNLSESSLLRQKAEEALLKRNSAKVGLPLSEADALKLIHDLEVHQIELEMINEALILAKEKAEDATEKCVVLYDFSPSGYFTLSRSGEIIGVNLTGAKMLGKERIIVKNSRFSSFLSANTKPVFSHFLEQVFTNKGKEICEVALINNAGITGYSQLTGIVSENRDQCLLTVVDISGRKQIEQVLEEKINEIMRFYNLAAEREIAMIELKKEVNDLLKDAGKEGKYTIV
jgi:PAS domain-containing protein